MYPETSEKVQSEISKQSSIAVLYAYLQNYNSFYFTILNSDNHNWQPHHQRIKNSLGRRVYGNVFGSCSFRKFLKAQVFHMILFWIN